MKFDISYFNKILNNPILNKFDYIYIYSDFRYFLSQNLNNKKFVSDFLKIFLQKKKTLILPSFSYSKKKFDIMQTKSSVGFLSNYILNKKNSLRSKHPLFSYIAIGPKKNILKNIGKSAFGENSVHAKLLFKNCCFLHIGRDLKYGNTLVHHVEQNLNASYRFDKKFNVEVFSNNNFLDNNYKAYVRRNYNKNTDFTFSKVLKTQKMKNLIIYLNREKNFKSLFFYPYDKFYFLLHSLYLKNNKIFIKS